MSHLTSFLPQEIELGAVRRVEYSTEVVRTDGGGEVRNARWSEPLISFEISFPPSERDQSIYQAVIDLYRAALGGLHSFNFTDWTDETGSTVIRVRFDSALSITGIASHLDHIDTLTLVEVR